MNYEIINRKKKELGLTNAMISEMTGITVSTLDKITSGANQNPKLDTLQAIADAIGCRLDDFVSGSNSDVDVSAPVSPEALALARRYDEIQDPLDRKMVEFAVNIGLLRNAPHDARPAMPPLFSPDWFVDHISGEDPRVARRQDVEVIGRGRRG